MWYEFPEDPLTFDIETQFMFGSSILVAPKVAQKFLQQPLDPTKPAPEFSEAEPSMSYSPSDKANFAYEIDVYLPPTELWYFYPTKAGITQ